MSASGTKRTSLVQLHMSAFDPKRTRSLNPAPQPVILLAQLALSKVSLRGRMIACAGVIS